MTDKLKNTLLVVACVTSLALGGAALAGAASNGGGSNNGSGSSSSQLPAAGTAPSQPHGYGAGGLPPQRSDEQLLTGTTEQKVRAAALAKLPGATIERIETDADGHAAYEAHVTKSDGSRATVYVNTSFDVVAVEAGP